MRISLAVLAGSQKGSVFRFEGHDIFLVGRSRRAHFQVPPKDIVFARFHFLLEVNPPACRLLDLGSTDGTRVNGEPVAVADLGHRDRIQVGRTTFQVFLQDPGAKAAAALKTAGTEPRSEPQNSASPPSHAADWPEGDADTLPSPYQLRHVEVLPGVCVVCEGPLTVASPAQPSDTSPASLPPLCLACREEIHNHPQPFADYQILRELGRGSLGVVYLALRTADGTIVALKTITPNRPTTKPRRDSFLKKVNDLRRLSHPLIVPLWEAREVSGTICCALGYVRGTSAARLLSRYGPLPPAQATRLIGEVLEALEFAHARGFVHRDVKPGNVLLTEAGRAVLTDFGLARVYQESPLGGLTLSADGAEPFAFLAPERLFRFGEAQPAADQYGAAATLYYLLTGCPVHDLPPEAAPCVLKLLHEEPVPIQARRPDLPADLAAVIHRALARKPEARFVDVAEMRQALAGCAL